MAGVISHQRIAPIRRRYALTPYTSPEAMASCDSRRGGSCGLCHVSRAGGRDACCHVTGTVSDRHTALHTERLVGQGQSVCPAPGWRYLPLHQPSAVL
jgi:hypothetical protein